MATFQNQATLTYGGTVTTSNVVTGELQQAVSVTKHSVTDSYTTGEVLTYIISLVNGGTTTLTDLTVQDWMGLSPQGQTPTQGNAASPPLDYEEGSLSYYLNGVRQGAPVVSGPSPLTITGITVPGEGNTFLVYRAMVNEYAAPTAGGSIANTVTVTGTALPTAITATDTVTASSEAMLTISKSLSPTTVSEGDRLTYSFVIRNFGNSPVGTTQAAVVTDAFDPLLSGVTVTFNGQSWVEGTQYTYDQSTGVFATLSGSLSVPAATYTQNATTGAWTVEPGVSTLTVVGTV